MSAWTAKPVLLSATIPTLVLNTCIAPFTSIIVTTALDTLVIHADVPITAVGVLDTTISADSRSVTLCTITILTNFTLPRVTALIETDSSRADVVDRALIIDPTTVLAAVAHTRLTYRALVVDTTTRRTLIVLIAELPLGTAVIIATTWNTQAVVVAHLTDFARLIAAATISALPGPADLIFGAARRFDAARNAAVISAKLS